MHNIYIHNALHDLFPAHSQAGCNDRIKTKFNVFIQLE